MDERGIPRERVVLGCLVKGKGMGSVVQSYLNDKRRLGVAPENATPQTLGKAKKFRKNACDEHEDDRYVDEPTQEIKLTKRAHLHRRNAIRLGGHYDDDLKVSEWERENLIEKRIRMAAGMTKPKFVSRIPIVSLFSKRQQLLNQSGGATQKAGARCPQQLE